MGVEFTPFPALVKPPAAPPSPQETAMRARIEKTSKDFEASFLQVMLGEMFDSLPTGGPFGGGEAEGAMRSFMTDAFSKQMTKAGGIGLAPTIQAQMLKMQGLS